MTSGSCLVKRATAVLPRRSGRDAPRGKNSRASSTKRMPRDPRKARSSHAAPCVDVAEGIAQAGVRARPLSQGEGKGAAPPSLIQLSAERRMDRRMPATIPADSPTAAPAPRRATLFFLSASLLSPLLSTLTFPVPPLFCNGVGFRQAPVPQGFHARIAIGKDAKNKTLPCYGAHNREGFNPCAACRAPSAPEQHPRLAGDLRQHRGVGGRRVARAVAHRHDQRDTTGDLRQPRIALRLRIALAAAEELAPQLLEIARAAGDQQPLPRVAGVDPRRIGLRPVEPERLAEPGEGARQHDLVTPAPCSEIGEADRPVELAQPHRALP